MHTKGPWRYEEARRGNFNIITDDAKQTVVVTPNDEYNCYGNIPNEDDARLIAAAPDLLTALKDLMAALSSDSLSSITIMKHRAADAIEKATVPKLSVKNVELRYAHVHDIRNAAHQAFTAEYEYFLWQGRIFKFVPDTNEEEYQDTGMTAADIR